MRETSCNCRNDLCTRLLATVFVVCLLTGMLGVLCYVVAGPQHAGWQIAGTSLLVALGAFLVGGLLGLIFGIPRVPQAPANSLAPPVALLGAPPAGRSRYQDNTSLEKISDWLTTLLVGAGLTQLNALPGFLRRIGAYLAPAMGEFPGRGAYALGLVLSSLLLGFFTFYLLSRICLADILPEVYLGQIIASVDSAQLVDDQGARTLQLDPAVAPQAQQLRAVPMSYMQTPAALAAWAKAHAAAGDFAQAEAGYRAALQLDPRNSDCAFELAEVLLEQEKYEEAIKFLEQARNYLIGSADERQARLIDRELLFAYLYAQPPYGFENAIRVGEQYVKADPKHPRAWTLLACAYGQKFAYLKQQNPHDPALGAIRANVLRCIQEVKNLGSENWLATLRRTWQGASADENDLMAFKNDPEFVKLLSMAPG